MRYFFYLVTFRGLATYAGIVLDDRMRYFFSLSTLPVHGKLRGFIIMCDIYRNTFAYVCTLRTTRRSPCKNLYSSSERNIENRCVRLVGYKAACPGLDLSGLSDVSGLLDKAIHRAPKIGKCVHIEREIYRVGFSLFTAADFILDSTIVHGFARKVFCHY